MRHDDYLELKRIAAALFAAETDEMRQVIGKKLEDEFRRIDALIASRELG